MSPAIPYADTPVVDQPWDGPANEARLKNTDGADVYRRCYAWVDPDADPDTKAAYKLPHHEVDSDGKVGAANVNGARNALSRLPQSKIPAADQDAVRAHLQKHIDKFNSQSASSQDEARGLVERVEQQAVGGFVRLLTAGKVWAVTEAVAAELAELHGATLSHSTLDRCAAILGADAAKNGRGNNDNGVAVIPLQGPLLGTSGGGGLFALLFGGAGLGQFQTQLRQAAADPGVSAIVMDVDSPGGLVDQIPEVAADVRAARAQKPVVAVANGQAASAAYWLASQADEISVTPSGEAGSIGVYLVHRDLSEAHAMCGIDPTLIKAGKYKAEANPYEPLGDEARAQLQSEVDDYYDMFTADVAKGRGVAVADVKNGFGEGRSLLAKRAKAANVADHVETLEAAISRVRSPAGRAKLDRRRAERAERDGDVVPESITPVSYTAEEKRALADLHLALDEKEAA